MRIWVRSFLFGAIEILEIEFIDVINFALSKIIMLLILRGFIITWNYFGLCLFAAASFSKQIYFVDEDD